MIFTGTPKHAFIYPGLYSQVFEPNDIPIGQENKYIQMKLRTIFKIFIYKIHCISDNPACLTIVVNFIIELVGYKIGSQMLRKSCELDLGNSIQIEKQNL